MSPSGEQTIAFVFLRSIVIAVAISLGKLYAGSTCSMFPLKSNASEKNQRTTVLPRSFLHILLHLRCSGSISPKAILIFPKNFLNFRLVTIKKYVIINLSSKGYASVVLSDSDVALVSISLSCLVYTWCCIIGERCPSNFLVFHILGGISSRLTAFLLSKNLVIYWKYC